MKSTATKKNYPFILLLCGMFFITGSDSLAQCGPCLGNKVRITKMTCAYVCFDCHTKCVREDQLQKYYDQGWTFGGGCRGRKGCGGNSIASGKVDIEATSLFVDPDPISNSTKISLTLGQPEKISLKIYDNAGSVVKVLAENEMTPGDKEFEWNIENVSNGIYMLRMQASTSEVTKKFILIR
jgi:hypothetical protein